MDMLRGNAQVDGPWRFNFTGGTFRPREIEVRIDPERASVAGRAHGDILASREFGRETTEYQQLAKALAPWQERAGTQSANAAHALASIDPELGQLASGIQERSRTVTVGGADGGLLGGRIYSAIGEVDFGRFAYDKPIPHELADAMRGALNLGRDCGNERIADVAADFTRGLARVLRP